MRERLVKGTDAEGREVIVRRLIPETTEDVEALRRRARTGEIDDREGFADREVRRRGRD